jgi:LPS sulfotransferase NodH
LNSAFASLFDHKPLDFDVLLQYQSTLAQRKPYLIYFTARSGSSHLADLLTNTGVAGRPGEYLNPQLMPRIKQGIEKRAPGRANSLFGYLHWLLENRSTANGAFGLKATYPHLKPLIATGLDRLLFAGFAPFFLTRRNIVSQAISLYTMTETKLSHSNKAIPAEVAAKAAKLAYNGERIRHWVSHLWDQELALAAYFAESEIAATPLDYDELTQDPDTVVGRITHACGAGRPTVLQSAFAKVRGSRSDELSAQFLDDAMTGAFLSKLGIPKERLGGA